MKHQIIVVNIGTVLDTDCGEKARDTYQSYVNKAANNDGRGAGESVVWMTDDDVYTEFAGRFTGE